MAFEYEKLLSGIAPESAINIEQIMAAGANAPVASKTEILAIWEYLTSIVDAPPINKGVPDYFWEIYDANIMRLPVLPYAAPDDVEEELIKLRILLVESLMAAADRTLIEAACQFAGKSRENAEKQ